MSSSLEGGILPRVFVAAAVCVVRAEGKARFDCSSPFRTLAFPSFARSSAIE